MSESRRDDLRTLRLGAQGTGPTERLFPSVEKIAQGLLAADSRFGETLVGEGALTREQLADAVAGHQALRGQGVTMRLGEVLLRATGDERGK